MLAGYVRNANANDNVPKYPDRSVLSIAHRQLIRANISITHVLARPDRIIHTVTHQYLFTLLS